MMKRACGQSPATRSRDLAMASCAPVQSLMVGLAGEKAIIFVAKGAVERATPNLMRRGPEFAGPMRSCAKRPGGGGVRRKGSGCLDLRAKEAVA